MGSFNDPIADLLTRIRNASLAQKLFFDIEHSTMKESITKVLQETGFISRFLLKEENKKKTMRIFLKYGADRKSAVQGIERVSKPSLRKYVSHTEIPVVLKGMGISILTTPKGVMHGESARKNKVGGEVLCLVW